MDTSKTAAGMNKKTAKAARKAAAAAAAATAAASTGSGPAAAAAAAASTATRVQQQAEDPFPPSLSGSSAPFPISAAKPLLSTTATGALTASAAVQLAQRLAAVSLQDASLNPAAAAESRHDGGDADFDRFDVDLDAEGPSFSTKDLYVNPTPEKYDRLVKQLTVRMADGQGETIMELGIEDDGSSMKLDAEAYASALSTLKRAADSLSADLTVLHERRSLILPTSSANEFSLDSLRIVESSMTPRAEGADNSVRRPSVALEEPPIPGAELKTNDTDGSSDEKNGAASPNSGHYFAHVLIRRRPGEVADILELRIAVVGNVDAGKSTLLGVLTKDVLDDGRGKARVNLFRHKHEMESGRTSSVGLEMMGFNSKGQVVTPAMLGKPKISWDDICVESSKVLSFIDLAGHEKYLKTTVFGMTGCAPDFVMLMIGSNAGIIGMTKEHLGLALALNVPVYIVITKIDMCPRNILESTIKQLTKILKSSGCRKIPMFIRTIGDVLVTAGNFVSERVCPIFLVSNITGQGLDLLKTFLNVIHANGVGRYDSSSPVEYQITDTFSVPGVGTVVSGTVMGGMVHVGDSLLLGPDSTGHFTPTIVKSIQRKRVNVPYCSAGQSASFALKKVKRSSIRKGMVMLSRAADAKAVFEFEAEVLVLYHSTTIGAKYQAMLHCGCVRQTAKIVGMDKQVLRTGDRAMVRFRFIQHPEYLKIGTRLLFREGRTKGVGKVVRLGPRDPKEAGPA